MRLGGEAIGSLAPDQIARHRLRAGGPAELPGLTIQEKLGLGILHIIDERETFDEVGPRRSAPICPL